MATENNYKYKFDRKYWYWNPDRYKGPAVATLDTIVKPKPAPPPAP